MDSLEEIKSLGQKILDLYDAGFMPSQIAEHIDTSLTEVIVILKKNGKDIDRDTNVTDAIEVALANEGARKTQELANMAIQQQLMFGGKPVLDADGRVKYRFNPETGEREMAVKPFNVTDAWRLSQAANTMIQTAKLVRPEKAKNTRVLESERVHALDALVQQYHQRGEKHALPKGKEQ